MPVGPALSLLDFVPNAQLSLSFLSSAPCECGHIGHAAVNTALWGEQVLSEERWVERHAEGGDGARGMGVISGGMLAVSKETHFAHGAKQTGASRVP